ncbi:MAG: hypothetical protein ACK4TA_25490, partial [Saprospiraceae bacterium]
VRWQGINGPSLDQVLGQIDGGRSGRWFVSARFSDIEAAHEWHIPLHEWDALPEGVRAEMAEYIRVKSQMRHYEDYLNARSLENRQNERSAASRMRPRGRR